MRCLCLVVIIRILTEFRMSFTCRKICKIFELFCFAEKSLKFAVWAQDRFVFFEKLTRSCSFCNMVTIFDLYLNEHELNVYCILKIPKAQMYSVFTLSISFIYLFDALFGITKMDQQCTMGNLSKLAVDTHEMSTPNLVTMVTINHTLRYHIIVTYHGTLLALAYQF